MASQKNNKTETAPPDLSTLRTFDLVLNIAGGKYTEQQKFEALEIIKSREPEESKRREKSTKPPLAGSKAEKILKLSKAGNNPKEIGEILQKKHKIRAYPAEIYRVINKYDTATV